jgi:predicted dehydrogenase
MTVGVGIVGCGNIAGRYAEDIGRQLHLRLIGATDADTERAHAFTTERGIRVFADLDEMLSDPAIEVVAILTPWRSHAAITRRCLEAGRHVFSEKPLAVTAVEARELVALAGERERGLAAAPIVAMGELAQTARRWVDEGRLGPIRLAYADANWGRIESWHPDPEPFYEIGPLFDVGIYPITLLTALLGPVTRVSADARRLLPERVAQGGRRFGLAAPDHVVAILEHDSGTATRLTVNFYVAEPARQRGVELHGDAGSLWLSSWFESAGTLEHAPWGEPPRPVPLLRESQVAIPWAAGLEELAVAVAEGRPTRGLSGEHAAHVIDVIETVLRAAEGRRPLDVGSRFAPSPPMDWALGATARGEVPR